jgi:hypothetical protein
MCTDDNGLFNTLHNFRSSVPYSIDQSRACGVVFEDDLMSGDVVAARLFADQWEKICAK